MAIDTSENFTISALVPVVLLDGVLLERLAARVAREEHHDDFSHFHDIHFAHVLFCAWTQLRRRARNERFGERNVIFILQCFGFACLENENLESNGVKKVYRSEVNIHFNLSLIVILHYGADAGKDAWVTRDTAHAEIQH